MNKVLVRCPHCKKKTEVKTDREIIAVLKDCGEKKETCISCNKEFMLTFEPEQRR